MGPVERTEAAFRRLTETGRPEVWIALRAESEVLADAAAIEARLAAGEVLPLAGLTLAVKDNIDALGLPTTAACPAFSYIPGRSSPAVERLVDAGALLLGKTNLDQFATGLVGTRSPYGAVRDARRPDHVSGGSSSGSAIAVALGIADVALGTDTAGSGRVPAAFQGIVGIKPTRGLVPTVGVVPACRELDCVTVLARELEPAELAMSLMVGPAPADPLSRTWSSAAPIAAPPVPRIGVFGSLPDLTPAAHGAFERAESSLRSAGAVLVEVDPEPFLKTARLLYDGAFVAERHAAVGAFVEANRDRVDPVVGDIVIAAASRSATQLVSDRERLDRLRPAVGEVFADIDALLTPTTTRQPTIAAVAADPVTANSRLGVYTNFVNLLDLCAVAVPAGTADGGQFGVTVVAPAFADRVAADIGAMIASGRRRSDPSFLPPAVSLFVVGAHLTGMPLNHELTDRRARLRGEAVTAPSYRLFRLGTKPAKPGLVRVAEDGAQIRGEVWLVPPTGLASLLADLPSPMTLGGVELEDGSRVVGFQCEQIALQGAEDITAGGGWRAHLSGT